MVIRMLEIFLTMVTLFLLAKRRGRGRRRYNLRLVRINPDLALSTLASKTVITLGLVGSADGAYRCISVRASWTLKGASAADGPILFGYAHSDFTVTEIKEAIETAASISVGDQVSQERANRKVRVVGQMDNVSSGVNSFNDGRPLKTRLNWLIPIGKAVNMWCYNDGAALLTTGSIVSCTGNLWVKDSS